MAKLLVFDEARKEFATLRRTFDEVNSQLQTKFSQNSIKFVKEVVLEDEIKLKGIPPEDCYKILLWRLEFPIEKPSTHEL